jgi:hypothetical protein
MDENAVDFVPRQFIKFTPTKFEWHMNGNGDDNLDYDDIPADVWLHHAVVKTADQLTYYRNGIEASSGTFTQPLDFPQPLFFGGDNEAAAGENWSGLMSEVRIYDRALSADEIGQLAGTPVDPGTDGLVAFYALENDVLDSSGNGNDGTIVGATTFVDGPAGYGMAMEFDGESYVDCGTDDSLDITGPISMSIWIRPGTDGNVETAPLCKADASAGWSWQLRYGWGSGGKPTIMGFQFNATGGSVWIFVNQELPVGEWCHIAASHDGATVKCYLNGVETNSAPMTDFAGGPSTLLIGSDGWRSDWIGAVDEVVIYNRALSDGEVRYLAGERVVDPSLVIYYSFDEVSDIVADQSGKGHDGVVNGEVTAEADGMYNGAANFATGGYLDLDGPSFPAEDIPTSAMTLAAWIKCENTGGHHAIFNSRAADETWINHPSARSNGQFRWLLRSYGGNTIFDIRAGAVAWDEWLHYAGTYDKASGKAALYINGELVSEVDIAEAADIAGDWGMGARVGKNVDEERPFTGLMDEFRMYTRALSQDEILDIMQGM